MNQVIRQEINGPVVEIEGGRNKNAAGSCFQVLQNHVSAHSPRLTGNLQWPSAAAAKIDIVFEQYVCCPVISVHDCCNGSLFIYFQELFCHTDVAFEAAVISGQISPGSEEKTD